MSESVEDLKKYWKSVGKVYIFDSNGTMVVGWIIDIFAGSFVIKDVNGIRHWMNADSIVEIREVGD